MKKSIILMMAVILTFSMALTGCQGKTEEEKLEDSLQAQLEELDREFEAEMKAESEQSSEAEADPERYDLDFLADVESHIMYSGAEGSGSAYIRFPDEYSFQVGDYTLTSTNFMYCNEANIIYENSEIGVANFSCDPYDAVLKEGDTLTVKFGFDTKASKFFKEKNITCRKSVSFTVPSLGNIVTSPSELSAENIEELKNGADETIKESRYTDTVIDSVYFGTAKPGVDTEGVKYKIIVLYTAVSGSIVASDEFPCTVADNIISDDGTLKYEMKLDCSAYALSFSLDDTLSAFKEDFDLEKIA